MPSAEPASSPRRRRRGSDTRRRVEEAAARRFTKDGYAAATLQAIATDAGVHVQTIYLAYRTKSALLAATAARLVAGEEDPASHPSERKWARAILAEPDPRVKLRRYVTHIGEVAPRITPLLDVLRSTAPAEPDVAAFLVHMELARREGALELLGNLVPQGTWRAELTPERIADVTSALASPDTLRWLVERCGWEQRAAEDWIVQALERELLEN